MVGTCFECSLWRLLYSWPDAPRAQLFVHLIVAVKVVDYCFSDWVGWEWSFYGLRTDYFAIRVQFDSDLMILWLLHLDFGFCLAGQPQVCSEVQVSSRCQSGSMSCILCPKSHGNCLGSSSEQSLQLMLSHLLSDCCSSRVNDQVRPESCFAFECLVAQSKASQDCDSDSLLPHFRRNFMANVGSLGSMV